MVGSASEVMALSVGDAAGFYVRMSGGRMLAKEALGV